MNWLKNYALASLAFFSYLSPFLLLWITGLAYEIKFWLQYDVGLGDEVLSVLLTFLMAQPTILLLVYRRRLAKIWKHLDLGRLE